jgi:hypothetical protein
MLRSVLRLASTVATVLVALGFVLFAIDETGEGSRSTVSRLEGTDVPSPGAKAERAREQRNGSVREAIDDANDVLLAPFSGLVEGWSDWASRGVSALLGFLLYGLGLRLLANYIPQPRRREPASWTEP